MITAVTKDIMCTYICNSSLAPSFKSSKCCFLGPFTYTAMFSHTAILQIRYCTVCKISIPLSTISQAENCFSTVEIKESIPNSRCYYQIAQISDYKKIVLFGQYVLAYFTTYFKHEQGRWNQGAGVPSSGKRGLSPSHDTLTNILLLSVIEQSDTLIEQSFPTSFVYIYIRSYS